MVGLKDLKDDETPTYDKWRDILKREYNSPDTKNSWIQIGEWLFNAKGNIVYESSTVCYHMCMENYNRIYHSNQSGRCSMTLPSISPIEDGCALCKKSLPDGIKMIALLEKL